MSRTSNVIYIYLLLFVLVILGVMYGNGSFDGMFGSDSVPDIEPEVIKEPRDPMEYFIGGIFVFAGVMFIFAIIEMVYKLFNPDTSKKSIEEELLDNFDDDEDNSDDDEDDDEDDDNLECLNCNIDYLEEDSNANRSDRFCSINCEKKSIKAADDYECCHCESDYYRYDSNANKPKKYCCRTCEKQYDE